MKRYPAKITWICEVCVCRSLKAKKVNFDFSVKQSEKYNKKLKYVKISENPAKIRKVPEVGLTFYAFIDLKTHT